MIKSFIKYLQYEKRYSPHTITSYESDLNQFSRFLLQYDPNQTVITVDYRSIRHWIVSLVENGLDAASVNRKTASLKAFYKFLLKREEISTDPTRKVRSLKVKKKLPQFVRENDMFRVLDHCHFDENFSGHRDKLMLEMLYGTGIRLSELINLKEEDVDERQSLIKVLGKRNKERIIPFSESLGELIKTYKISKKNEFGQNVDQCLLVTDMGEQCYPMFVYRTVKRYLNQITTLEKQSPHVLRHTFATHLLNKGAELNAVKDLLGHTSLAATQVYTHNSLEKLKTVFDKAHPKA